jgi:RNA polymerase sigma-70 factor (ECF subfamily)
MNGTVRRAASGDRAAFGKLYDEYERPVYLMLVGRLGTREDAEDALQSAFLAAWERLPRLRRPERFVPWLFRIATNKATDLLRRRRIRLTADTAVENLIAPQSGSPERDGLGRVLATLKPDSRSIVLLRVVHGWTAEEVAAAIGKSAATVRRKYARALEVLRKRLDAGESHDG